MTVDHDVHADRRDMHFAHNMLRREFGDLPALVRGVPDGDPRAVVVADHIAPLVGFLHGHHVSDDEIVWPLLERGSPEARAVVELMETQHARVSRDLRLVYEAGIGFHRQWRSEGDR